MYLPREQRTTLALNESQVGMAALARDPLQASLNILLYQSVEPPEPERWCAVHSYKDASVMVSDLGHAVVLRSLTPRMELRRSYPKVRAYLNNSRTFLDCHRAVAESHIPRPCEDPTLLVRHRNSDPRVYNTNNLEWGTPEQNRRDRYSPLYGIPVAPPPSEIWLPHPRYAGLWVSNRGNFQQKYFERINTNGYLTSRRGTIVKKHVHIALNLGRKTNPRSSLLHRLVFIAFQGPLFTDEMVRHIDGDPHNNRLDNLEKGTAFDNAQDRDRHGRTQRGAARNALIPNATVVQVMREYFHGAPVRLLAKQYGISAPTVYSWICGRARRDVTKAPWEWALAVNPSKRQAKLVKIPLPPKRCISTN